MSLKAKIIGSFTLIVLLSLGTVAGMGNRFLRTRYSDFSYRLDVARARALARVLGEWATDPSKDLPLPSWADEGPLLMPGGMMPGDMMSGRMMPGDMMPGVDDRLFPRRPEDRGWMNRMMDRMEHRGMPDPNPSAPQPMVITDEDGIVLLDTADYGGSDIDFRMNEGARIRRGEKTVGYLYLGTMIPGSQDRDSAGFFRAIGAATWSVTFVVFLFAMVFGLLLTRHIVWPVRNLNDAASEVERGNLGFRVRVNRNDELGDLSRGFNSMTESLERADTQRRRLIADSAHELRTPVSIIRARIEMMEEGVYPLDQEGLAALAAESDRLVRLVEELRVLADLESTETRPRLTSLDAERVLGEALESVEPVARRLGISLDRRMEGTLGTVTGDSHQLHRLLANLLSNGIRHARSRVRLSMNVVGENWVCTVEDDGPGIPPSERERIFDRYYRVDASRNRDSGGSGLGLAICREIVRGHGGSIMAGASADFGGAKITVTLPRTA